MARKTPSKTEPAAETATERLARWTADHMWRLRLIETSMPPQVRVIQPRLWAGVLTGGSLFGSGPDCSYGRGGGKYDESYVHYPRELDYDFALDA